VVTPDSLANVPLFESLTDDQRTELANWFEPKRADEGVCLAGEGASGYSFFVLKEGTAAVTADGKSVATLGPGDYFGEMAILGEGRRLATVTASTPVSLLAMFGTEFRRLEAAHPEIASAIRGTMEQRLVELDA
jgi:CRP-like cAMP-binding protein